MPAARRTSTLPISGADLETLRSTLARDYGAQVWEAAGERILVVRVPRGEPDIIQDIETAIEHLVPGDIQDLTHALLIGDDHPLAVPVHPFQQLMEQRLQADDVQAAHLRQRLKPNQHLLYKATGDPRKIVRLGLRLAKPSTGDWDDTDLEAWSTALGSDLDAGRLQAVQAIHIVADQDAARPAPGLFLQDLRQHRAETKERQALAAQVAQRQAPRTAPSSQQANRVAYAPLRSHESPVWPAADREPEPSAGAEPPATSLQEATLGALQQALAASGFDVLLRPAGHAIDLAAERASGDVQRIVAWTPERLTSDVATDLLRTVRGLDCDVALVVCQDIEPEARKRLVATKVRCIHPRDVPALDL